MGTTPNPNWTRWIWASVGKHFLVNVATPNSIPFLVEGIDERDTTFMESPDRAELRINGPDTRELSAGYWRLWVEINVLVTTYMDGQQKNAYTLESNLGLFHEAADTVIPVFRYGDGVDDDGTLLGCLSPRTGKNDSLRIVHFGQLNRTERLKQGVVDGRYVMYLCT
jgi:hypothetical protein